MSKEFESLCLTSQMQDCPFPTREPAKGRFSTVIPHLAELGLTPLFLTQQSCGQYSRVPAGEVPLQIRDRFFQHTVVLSWRFPELGVQAAPMEREGFHCAGSWSSTEGAQGRGKAGALLKSMRNLPELHQAEVAEGSHPPPSQEMKLL